VGFPSGQACQIQPNSPAVYICHRPETTLRYQIVQAYWPAFQAELASHARYVPAYVTAGCNGPILKDARVPHASAVEEFRPFVSDGAAYQKAWEEYRMTVRQDNGDIDTAESGISASSWSTVELKIQIILSFAKA